MFPPRSSRSRFVRSPRASGTAPVRPFPASSSRVTRPAASVVTPYHSPSGASVSQFAPFVQFAPSVAAWNASSAARSRSGAPHCRPMNVIVSSQSCQAAGAHVPVSEMFR